MEDVLPPQAGLTVNGLIYQYSVEKDASSDLQVTIQNEYSLGEGYIIQQTDDWSQLPGSTINRMVTFGGIPREYIGNGEIATTGEGKVYDPYIAYSYRYDECYVPLSSPDCPGYNDALLKWLETATVEPSDPFYDEWVQLTLNRESEVEDEDDVTDLEDEEKEEEDAGIAALNSEIDIEGFVDGATQAAIMQSFATIPNFDGYYATAIEGGVYEDVLTLDDGEIQDNQRALSNLAQDQLHRNMVRSQYNRN